MSIIERVSGVLTDVTEVARTTEVPADPAEAADLLAAVLRSGDELANLVTRICPELKAESGRCPRCGRIWLLRRALWAFRQHGRGHKRGGVGCLFSLPAVLVRRSQATDPLGGGFAGASPLLSASAGRRGAGRTTHEGGR